MEPSQATLPPTTSIAQSNASTAPVAGGDVTAVASTSSSLAVEDKAAQRRARDAERKRAKRVAGDPELKARDAERKRAKRAADADLRVREADARSQRRVEKGDEGRVKAVSAKRQRRAADPELRAREAAQKRKRRAEQGEEGRRKDAARKRRRRADETEANEANEANLQRADETARVVRVRDFSGADGRFRRDFENHSFGHSCDVCDRLWFDNNLSAIGGVRNEANRLKALRVLWNEFGRQPGEHRRSDLDATDPRLDPFGSWRVCASCREALLAGRMPAMSKSNGYVYPARPPHLPELNSVEERLISPRLPFMSIRRLTRGNGQFGIKGQVVNVPIDVPSVVECLPRMVPEDVAIDVHVKRRLLSPATYKRGLVKRGNILAWLKHLEHTPLYRACGVRIDWSRLGAFDDDDAGADAGEDAGERGEEASDDDEIETVPDDVDLDDPLQLAIALNAVSKTIFFNEEGDRGPRRVELQTCEGSQRPRALVVSDDGRERTGDLDEAAVADKLVDQSHSLHVAPGENRSKGVIARAPPRP